jgi:hypothetical protein
MDTKSANPATLLLDLQQELRSLLLEETVTILNRKYTLRLLNEEETIWTYGFLNPKNTVSIAVAARLANISIGLRAIEGIPIEEVFKGTWEELDEEAKDALLKEHSEPQMVYAQLVMNWLRKQSSTFMNELHGAWQALEERRSKAQSAIKNSSGEDSEKEENKSLTESSQLGEQSSTDSE